MLPKELLLIIIVLGILVAAIGIYLFFLNQSQKRRPKKTLKDPTQPVIPTMDELIDTAKSPKSSLADLENAIDLVITHYPHMDAQPVKHLNFIYSIAKSKSTNAKLVMKLDRAMKEHNPDFTKDIDNSEKRGLNSR